VLTDQEVGDLRQDRVVPVGEVVAPEWALPSGFPEPEAPVRGFHLGRLLFLLQRDGDGMRVLSALGSGL
jgi:tRNA pseudouridine55 synthase